MDLAAAFATFSSAVSFEELPSDVVDCVKKLMLDQLGVTIAGSRQAGIAELLRTSRAWGGSGDASVLVHGGRLPAPLAALLNASMGRALDFDAVHQAAVVHLSVSSLAPCLALAERKGGVSGRQLITALAVGMEFMARLGLSFKKGFMEDGRTPKVHSATFGSAVAGAKLIGLDINQTISAMGLAYSQISGNLQNIIEGSVLVRVVQGFAAQAATQSVIFAEAGLKGPSGVFNGEYGYFRSYHEDRIDRQVLGANLGAKYHMIDTSIKRYPFCFMGHQAIESLKRIVHSRRNLDRSISGIHVRVTGDLYKLICEPIEAKRFPASVEEALFSLPFAMGATAVFGDLTLDVMTMASVADPRVGELAAKVFITQDESLETAAGAAPSVVEVRFSDGDLVVDHGQSLKGQPTNPMTFHDCAEKFRRCIAYGAPQILPADVEKLISHVFRLEKLENTSSIMDIL